jgi:ubiquinone biosynthesis O-methyltransferase
VLDVGCGDGEFALEFAQRGAIVTGIDASAAMIAAAKDRTNQAKADIAFQVGTAEHLPFPPEQFDVVTAITILCYIEDTPPVCRELARVLRAGGRLFISELGKWSTWAAARRVRAWMGSRLWCAARFRTAKELRGLVEQAGLDTESVRGAVYYPRCDIAARLMAPHDQTLARLGTLGAAFVALAARKPDRGI